MEWIKGLLIPLVEIVFIGGIVLFAGFYVVKGFWNAWSKQTKFFIKFKIRRKPYPETPLKWCLDCIDREIGYYDAKKMLMVEMLPDDQINETLYIFDQVLNSLKGGLNKNDRKYERSYSKIESKSELPKLPAIKKDC